MSAFAHELISASAGTGKTYQLTRRYLRLLFAEGQPERILALTFTRKAAGEFFEKIFQSLVRACESPLAAAELGTQLGFTLTQEQCLARLRLLFEALPRLRLSTYDSFFARLVRCFPYELGLSAAPETLSEAEQAEAQARVQRELLRLEEGEEATLREFWHAFRRATRGREEKRLADLLTHYIEEHQSLYLEAPEPSLWGRSESLWPLGASWLATPAQDGARLALEFENALPWTSLTPQQATDWRLFLGELATWRSGAPMGTSVCKFAEKLLAVRAQLARGEAQITVRKKQLLGPTLCEVALRFADHCLQEEVLPRLESTKGVHAILRLYEALYRERVRSLGKLTIEDMTRLLAGVGSGSLGLADPQLRLQLDYRLDARYDHWLLDEFQDTSHGQWRAIANLVDEVLTDVGGRRTFFAVGDTKQCLYMWRGSDDRLFERVAQRYEHLLQLSRLEVSYRSVPAVLEAVNTLFGVGASPVHTELAGEAVARRWAAMWSPHRSAPALEEKTGQAAWLLTAPKDQAAADADLVRLLRALRHSPKAPSLAVLTLTNREAARLVDRLRLEPDLPASLASQVFPGADTAVAVGLQSLLQLAAHPGDRLAWAHLRLTPLGPAFEREYGHGPGLASKVLELLSRGGFEALVLEWQRRVLPLLDPEDRFNPGRLARCRAAARAADERGESDPDVFLRTLRRLSVREVEAPGEIAVMTVHKAKGLDWDVVVLPDLDSGSLREARAGTRVSRDQAGAINWIAQLPRKDIAAGDPVLAAELERASEDAAFESLCQFYVALTRARRGLYVLQGDPGKSQACNYARLLAGTCGLNPRPLQLGAESFEAAWVSGSATWLAVPEVRPPAPQRGAEPQAPLPGLLLSPSPRPGRPCQPSKPGSLVRPRVLWQASLAETSERGKNVHRLLATLSWLAPEASPEQELRRQAQGLALDAECLDLATRLLLSPGVLPFFHKEGPQDEVWVERGFDLVSGGIWVSGRCDRVVLRRRAEEFRVELLDFKSGGSQVHPEHRLQVQQYRVALAALLELPQDRVRSWLVYPGVCFEVTPSS